MSSHTNQALVAMAATLLACQARAPAQLTLAEPDLINIEGSGDEGRMDFFPAIASSGDGHCVAIWNSHPTDQVFVRQTRVARSADRGQTWSAATVLSDPETAHAFIPSVAMDGTGRSIAVWSAQSAGIGTDYDLYFIRSPDHGLTWSAPAALNSNAATDTQTGFERSDDKDPRIFTDGAGTWLVFYTSTNTLGGTIATDPDLFVVRSTGPDGAGWLPPVLVNDNAGADNVNDRLPNAVNSGAGAWSVFWNANRFSSGSQTHVLTCRTTDNGATWSHTEPFELHTTSGATVLGTNVVDTDKKGVWVAVVSTESVGDQMAVSRSTDDGATWSDPVPLKPPGHTGALTVFPSSPNIRTDGNGYWAMVWQATDAAGESFSPDTNPVLLSYSSDNGATWSAPQPIDGDTRAFGRIQEQDLTLVPDFHGDWVAVWAAGYSIEGDVQTDFDILFARFALPDCNHDGIGDGHDPSPSCNTLETCERDWCGNCLPMAMPLVSMGVWLMSGAGRRRRRAAWRRIHPGQRINRQPPGVSRSEKRR